MSRHNHNLDAAIECTVRDTMNVDADATFETRVAGRIGGPARAARWPGFVLAGAVGVALMLSLVPTRTPGPAGIEPETRSVQPELTTERGIGPQHRPAAGTDPDSTIVEPAPPRISHRAMSTRAPAPPSRPMSTDEEATADIWVGSPIEIEALTPIEPIVLAPLQTSAVAPPGKVAIAPLSPMAGVHIEPLSPEE